MDPYVGNIAAPFYRWIEVKVMRSKIILLSEFRKVLAHEWEPVQLESSAIPSFLRAVPRDKLHQVHASGCIPKSGPELYDYINVVGGIDVYRHSPDDPVPYNKDWYEVRWDDGNPDVLVVDGPKKRVDHWLSEVPEISIKIRLA